MSVFAQVIVFALASCFALLAAVWAYLSYSRLKDGPTAVAQCENLQRKIVEAESRIDELKQEIQKEQQGKRKALADVERLQKEKAELVAKLT